MTQTQTELELTPSPAAKWTSYPAYKDSGIAWLGQIPEHWEVKRLKYVITMNPEVLSEDTDPDYILNYVDISNVDSHGLILCTQELQFETAPSRARRIVRAGDTIISTVRTYLRAISFILESKENLIVSTGFAVLRPNLEIYNKFLWRLVQSNEFVNAVVSHSEGVGYPAINPGRLAILPIWIPPLPEQRALAAFLDRETARINTLIAKKEQLIELLQEKRSALISHAVTKGLDATVPMKDSDVAWLGEIPERWEVKRLKYVVQNGLTNGIFKKKDQFGNGTKLVNVVNLYKDNFLIDFESLERVEVEPEEYKTFKVVSGDIFFVRSSLKLEGVGVAASIIEPPEPVVFECHVARVHPSSKIMLSKYLVNYLNSSLVHQRLVALAETTTMTTITQPKLTSLDVIVPPLPEQRAIAAYLDQE